MLVRDSPPVPLAAVTGAAAAVGGEQRRPCPFDVKIVHYVTDDGRYSAWTLELEVVLTTPSHDLRGLHHYGFCGARPPPPPLLELPPEVVAAVVGAEEGEEGMSLRAGSA